MIDASTPITSASTTIDVSTWRRLAPSVRSVANSRVRCAIVIESEFAITKLPTKSAMPPKASRKSRRNEMKLSRVASRPPAPARRRCAPARSPGRIDRTSREQLRPGRRPASCATAISSSRPCLSKSVCAVGQVEAGERRAAERRRAAELDDARRCGSALSGPFGLRRRSSRRPRSASSFAVLRSITTSPAVRPATRRRASAG